jgi:D-tyrosyl-tRNA(Tyr) deacylase
LKAVVQRVSRASVSVGERRVGERRVGEIGRGFCILLGVGRGDGEEEAVWLARKCAGLRVFEDDGGLMNLSLADVGGSALVVSQFTLYANCDKGRRPSFTDAAEPVEAERLYNVFVDTLRGEGIEVATGEFQARMMVEIHNEGPVTLIIER